MMGFFPRLALALSIFLCFSLFSACNKTSTIPTSGERSSTELQDLGNVDTSSDIGDLEAEVFSPNLIMVQLLRANTEEASVVGLPASVHRNFASQRVCAQGLKNQSLIGVRNCGKVAGNGSFEFSISGVREGDLVRLWLEGLQSTHGIEEKVVMWRKLFPDNIHDIQSTSRGLFVAAQDALYIYPQGDTTLRPTILNSKQGLPAAPYSSLAVKNENEVYVAGQTGIGYLEWVQNKLTISTFGVQNGFTGQYLKKIFLDSRERLWIGLPNAFSCMIHDKHAQNVRFIDDVEGGDPETIRYPLVRDLASFIDEENGAVPIKIPYRETRLRPGEMRDFLENDAGLFFATTRGPFFLPEGDISRGFYLMSSTQNNFYILNATQIEPAPNNMAWLGTESGLVLLNPNDLSDPSTFSTNVNPYLMNPKPINGLISINDHLTYALQAEGLWQLQMSDDSLENLSVNHWETSPWISDFLLLPNGSLFLSGRRSYIFNPADSSFSGIMTEEDLEDALLTHPSFDSINNAVWFSGSQGLSKVDLSGNEVPIIQHIHSPFSLPSNDVTAAVEENSESLWVGTTFGLSQINLTNGTIKNHLEGIGYASKRVKKIHLDHMRNLWVLTAAGAYIRLSNSNSFEPFVFDPTNAYKQPQDILEDDRGYVWLAGSDQVHRITLASNLDEFSRVSTHDFPELSGFGKIVEWSSQKFILAGNGRLYLLFDQDGQFQVQEILTQEGEHIPGITNIIKDDFGSIWLLSHEELYKIDPNTPTPEGLRVLLAEAPARIRGLQKSSNGDLWVFYSTLSDTNGFDNITCLTKESHHTTEIPSLPVILTGPIKLFSPDKEGGVWFSSYPSLWWEETASLHHFVLKDKQIYDRLSDRNTPLLPSLRATLILDRSDGFQYVGTSDAGIFLTNLQ